MHPAKTAKPEILEIGGEPLEGSGFETEAPANGFESYQPFAEGGHNQ